jgi:hypothetical protein
MFPPWQGKTPPQCPKQVCAARPSASTIGTVRIASLDNLSSVIAAAKIPYS